MKHLDTAILNNRPGFVKLFLENDVLKLDKYLTRSKLESFYKEVSCLNKDSLHFVTWHGSRRSLLPTTTIFSEVFTVM